MTRQRVALYSALMLVLLLAGTLLANGVRESRRVWDFGAWDVPSVEAACARHARDGSVETLARALKGLCWQYRVAGDEGARGDVAALGQELLDRTRAGEIDLEALDGDGVISQVLSVIREAGAR